MSIFLFCAGILVLFYAALSANVSRMRRLQRKHPEITDAEVMTAIRAHGNASEYVPLFAAIFLYLYSVQAGPFAAAIVIAATLSRILHAAGMLVVANTSERHPFRILGATCGISCYLTMGSHPT